MNDKIDILKQLDELIILKLQTELCLELKIYDWINTKNITNDELQEIIDKENHELNKIESLIKDTMEKYINFLKNDVYKNDVEKLLCIGIDNSDDLIISTEIIKSVVLNMINKTINVEEAEKSLRDVNEFFELNIKTLKKEY